MWCIAQCGYDQVRDGFTLAQGVMGRALRANEAEFLPEVRDDPGYIAALPGIVSELAVPTRRRAGAGDSQHRDGRRAPARHPSRRWHHSPNRCSRWSIRSARPSSSISRPLHASPSMRALCASVGALSEFSTRTLGRLLDLEAAQLTLGGAAADSGASFWRRPEIDARPDRGAETIAAVFALSSLSDYTWSVLDAADINVANRMIRAARSLRLPAGRGAQIGTLVGRSNTPITLEHEQVEAAILFATDGGADHAGQALQREQRAAVTDSLTGLLNRRGFDERCTRRSGRAERSGRPLTVVLTDCDDLKHVNDRFGHDGGDALLQGLARVLRQGKRVSDVAGRVGEMSSGYCYRKRMPRSPPRSPSDSACRFTSCARAAVMRLRALVSRSIPRTATSTELLRVAGQALYEAKQRGKDRLAGATAFS